MEDEEASDDLVLLAVERFWEYLCSNSATAAENIASFTDEEWISTVEAHISKSLSSRQRYLLISEVRDLKNNFRSGSSPKRTRRPINQPQAGGAAAAGAAGGDVSTW